MAEMHKINGKEISEGTIKKACEAYGISFEKKFEPITVCHLVVDVYENERIQFRERGEGDAYICIQNLTEAQKVIEAIQSAIDFVENK